MSGEATPPPAAPADRPRPAANLRQRNFSFVWLIPLLAAAIALYLGYRTVTQRGPLLTLSFATGESLSAGQTQVKYKSVALGTVESIDLSTDNKTVVVKVRMNSVGARFLTSHARYWVERPRLTPGDLSGLDTLVSGAFISVDPGPPNGRYQDKFTGLEQPPGVRSDEPGHTYQLQTETIGSLSSGSPVYFRDVQVGEVLSYNLGDGLGPVIVSVFVRAPYDRLVQAQSHFWKSSGITAQLQGGGFHVEFQSLESIIAGAITFDVPLPATDPPSAENTLFPLYPSYDDAQAAGYQTHFPIVAYFNSSISGLAKGAPVDVLGFQVGQVTDVKLIIDASGAPPKVRVAMDLQPERIFRPGDVKPGASPQVTLQKMVDDGMRVQLETGSYVTGQKIISLDWVKNAKTAQVTQEGDILVLPSQPGGFDDILASVTQITTKLSKIPFDKIGDNVNKLLLTANGTLGGPQLKQTLASLDATLKTADTTLGAVNDSYGDDSDFQHNLEQMMIQANSTLHSIQSLSDYLNRHPQALLLGRSGN